MKARQVGPLTAAAAAAAAAAGGNGRGGGGGGGGGSGSSSNSVAGGGGSSKGEFDPLIETVKAARSCSTIITSLLTFPRPGPLLGAGESAASATAAAAAAGVGVDAYGCLSLTDRASMAMDMVSSTSFGEAVREAMVRSPSRELRTNAMGVLASLARIDREIAAAMYVDESGGDGGGSSEFISQTTVMVRFYLSRRFCTLDEAPASVFFCSLCYVVFVLFCAIAIFLDS